MNSVQDFYLVGHEYLFFDIFYKDNKIYLIIPIRNEVIPVDDIRLCICNSETVLHVSKIIIKDRYEAISIYIYDYINECDDNNAKILNVSVTYNEIHKDYQLEHIITSSFPKYKLTLTTLFKDDYKLFPFFYKYYKDQGVEHFYMYYNGPLSNENNEIKDILNYDDITLIEWNYAYWASCKNGIHYAQPGQMHHAIYRYGKNISDYMIFCDLDEFLYIPTFTLYNYVTKFNYIDVFGFCNKLENNVDNLIPLSFPNEILCVEKSDYWSTNSKNIFKLEFIVVLLYNNVVPDIYKLLFKS